MFDIRFPRPFVSVDRRTLEEMRGNLRSSSLLREMHSELTAIWWGGNADASLALLAPGPGKIVTCLDMLSAFGQRYPEHERVAAFERTIRRILKRWKIHKPAVRPVLTVEARARGVTLEKLKEDELSVALIEAYEMQHLPGRHRFGTRYLKGYNGIPPLIALEQLDTYFAWERLVDITLRIADENILRSHQTKDVQAYSVERDTSLLESLTSDAGKNPLAILLEQEQRQENAYRIQQIFEQATPKQRALLTLLAEGWSIPEAACQIVKWELLLGQHACTYISFVDAWHLSTLIHLCIIES
jgi:hypothetical protein